MTRIWRYVLKTDTGFAPCIDDGILTLACCKPFIRRHAEKGDWIIGYFPKNLGYGRVAWVGQVSEKLPLGMYEKRHRRRRDAIYRLVHRDASGAEVLKDLPNAYHVGPRSRLRDKRGLYALVCEPFCYWGGNDEEAPPEIVEMAYYFVGQSAKNTTPQRVAALERWIKNRKGVHGTPCNAHEPPASLKHVRSHNSRLLKC